jgi:Tfp pilus assembly protein PilF
LTRSVRSLVAGGIACAAWACAANPPAVVAGAPRFPSFPTPVVPAALGASAEIRSRMDAAWLRLQAGDTTGAARDFDRLLADRPDFYPAETARAFVDLAEREMDRAGRRFTRVVEREATYVPAWLGLADVYLEGGREAEAIAALERVVALDPSQEATRSRLDLLRFRRVQALLSDARRAREAGRLDAAAAALEGALRLSPASVVILQDLAAIERARGALDAALAHAQRATELDPADGGALATLGDVLEARGDLAGAAEAYERAARIEGRAEWRAKGEDLRHRATLAALPPEFASIDRATAVTRGEVAALVGVRLEALVARSPRPVREVATDVRGHWAAPWILPVTQAGIMEIFPNHTFQPAALVRRGDLARIVRSLLSLAAAEGRPDLAALLSATPRFGDLPATHLVYAAAASAVAAGAMTSDEGLFHATRPVTGAELVAAIARVERLLDR